MIGRLNGILLEKQPPEVLIECAGVGYEVTLPMTSFYALPEIEQTAIIYTHFVVREDAQLLYGFANKTERKLFRLLIKVNGVGPKLALAILSGMSADQFVSAVMQDNVAAIIKIPGVGKKTAERLLIEIRDKIKEWQAAGSAIDGLDSVATPFTDSVAPDGAISKTFVTIDAKQEAITALVALGYTQAQANKAVSGIYDTSHNSEQLIRNALKSMI